MPAAKRPSGAGFYEEVLGKKRRAALAAAQRVESIDEDIALVRSLVRAELSEPVVDLSVVHRSVDRLIKAHDVRDRIVGRRAKGNENGLLESVKAVLHDVGDLLDAPESP